MVQWPHILIDVENVTWLQDSRLLVPSRSYEGISNYKGYWCSYYESKWCVALDPTCLDDCRRKKSNSYKNVQMFGTTRHHWLNIGSYVNKLPNSNLTIPRVILIGPKFKVKTLIKNSLFQTLRITNFSPFHQPNKVTWHVASHLQWRAARVAWI